MQIVTYLGFTLLSILMQFCVMDFIQEKLQDKKSLEFNDNGTSQKRHLRDVIEDIKFKPHALYYQTKISSVKNNAPEKMYSNTSLPDLLTTTDIPITTFEVIYDDNSTITEDSYTTESLYTIFEYDNVTEINFFGKSNDTTPKPKIMPKKEVHVDCNCNLLYKICDISCCCDDDCSEADVKLFPNCVKNTSISIKQDNVCYSSLFHFGNGPASSVLENLFCIVAINIPDQSFTLTKKNIEKMIQNHFLTWKVSKIPKVVKGFTNKLYEFGDPIGLIQNNTLYRIEIPTPMINSYCNGRKAISFLKDEGFTCKVKIRDLEMFDFLRDPEVFVISPTPVSINNTIINCSNGHCANWTTLVCSNLICYTYNKSIHEPFCTERTCTNLPLKIEYIFYYYDSKIINATLKFYVENVSMDYHYISQSFDIKFILANESIDKILKLSGSPGYVEGLSIIISRAAGNHTHSLYNMSLPNVNKYYPLPNNRNGVCVPSNISDNILLFGRNKRIICKMSHTHKKLENRTMECKSVQDTILQILGLKKNISVSPLGNPQDLKDIEWISLELPVENKDIFGNVHDSKLHCYNVITRYSIIFNFAKVNGNNKIISVELNYSNKNISLNLLEDVFTTLIVDISFVDVTKPSVFEYVTEPNIHFHLPKDFFFPFPSNEALIISINIYMFMILLCVISI